MCLQISLSKIYKDNLKKKNKKKRTKQNRNTVSETIEWLVEQIGRVESKHGNRNEWAQEIIWQKEINKFEELHVTTKDFDQSGSGKK